MKTENIGAVQGVSITKKKTSWIKVVKLTMYYAVIALLLCIVLLPFLTMFSKSFMTYTEVRELPVKLWAANMQFSNYAVAFQTQYLRMLFNTLIVCGMNILGATFMSAFTAFGFTRMKFMLKKPLFVLIMSTLMLPAMVTQIPTYILFANLHLLDSLFPLFISTFFGGGVLNIFLVMQFMRGIPKDVDNAAMIDGAGPFRIFFSIVFPLCKPVLLYIAISTFTGCWNDIQGPLIYLNSAGMNKYTLGLGFYFDFGAGGKYELYKNWQMALGVLMTIPPAVVFFIFQRQLLDGVVMTGVKG